MEWLHLTGRVNLSRVQNVEKFIVRNQLENVLQQPLEQLFGCCTSFDRHGNGSPVNVRKSSGIKTALRLTYAFRQPLERFFGWCTHIIRQ